MSHEESGRLAVARVDGAEISILQLGSSPRAVYVMHGGLGLDHTYLRPWLDPLSENATVVYYDHRGNGRSSREGLDAVDHARWADDCEGLRRDLGHERIALLGHSYGSFLALEYAIRHPERLTSLVLVATAPKIDFAPDLRRATPEQIALFTCNAHADDAAFREAWRALLPLYFHRPNPEAWEAMDRTTRYSAAAHARAFSACIMQYDVLAALPRLRVPTLVISGEHDFLMPPEQGERVARAIPGAEHVVIADAGHFPFIERPGETLAKIQGFLSAR